MGVRTGGNSSIIEQGGRNRHIRHLSRTMLSANPNSSITRRPSYARFFGSGVMSVIHSPNDALLAGTRS
jgi:hypothetical protein